MPSPRPLLSRVALQSREINCHWQLWRRLWTLAGHWNSAGFSRCAIASVLGFVSLNTLNYLRFRENTSSGRRLLDEETDMSNSFKASRIWFRSSSFLSNRRAGRFRTAEWRKNVAREKARDCAFPVATFFRHSAVLNLPAVLLRKVCIRKGCLSFVETTNAVIKTDVSQSHCRLRLS